MDQRASSGRSYTIRLVALTLSIAVLHSGFAGVDWDEEEPNEPNHFLVEKLLLFWPTLNESETAFMIFLTHYWSNASDEEREQIVDDLLKLSQL